MSSAEVLETPVKSENDKKSYRLIRLENGMKALLISAPVEKLEPTTVDSDKVNEMDSNKKAACALCIDVGYFSDPSEIQGLAHLLGVICFLLSLHFNSTIFFHEFSVIVFLEHLIFMGSEKYPDENEFEQFIQNSGGSDNASTNNERTVFYFQVREHLLDDALDRFSYLIKAPLLLKESMMREREAVDSEFLSRKNVKTLRRQQILARLCQKSHPFANFDCGNLKTLKENIDDEILHEKVREFKRKHYSAHRMSICMQSEQSLDNLQVNQSNTYQTNDK